jgi:hypothetical protein
MIFLLFAYGILDHSPHLRAHIAQFALRLAEQKL